MEFNKSESKYSYLKRQEFNGCIFNETQNNRAECTYLNFFVKITWHKNSTRTCCILFHEYVKKL